MTDVIGGVEISIPELSYKVAIPKFDQGVQEYSVSADDPICVRIAKRLKIAAVSSLRGVFALSAVTGGVRVSGHLSARLERVCVATLEPVDEVIEEEFVIELLTDIRKYDEGELDPEAPAVEPLDCDTIDLGEILVQQLAMAMDAYPRKPNTAVLGEPRLLDGESSPFSVLKDLTKPPDREN